jgi:shikimate dehydrogenase
VITASTRLVGLIGDPVSHSLSPRMQNAAFAAAGLDWAYVPLPVRADQIDAALAGLAALAFVGANVTIPHKEAVACRCDTLSPVSRACGSVNTVVVGADGALHGDSTDGVAVTGGIAAVADPALLGGSSLVLGAGGAARAAAAALLQAGADEVLVHARRPEAAAALVAALAPLGPIRAVAAIPARLPAIVVNATPLGGARALTESPLAADALGGVHVVCDLAYRPDARATMLCAAALAAGVAVVDGLEVLVRQGAVSFERWTGVAPSLVVMRAALAG